jgi:hypothetical protein
MIQALFTTLITGATSGIGLAAYARCLSAALAPRGIHVLTVFPSPLRAPRAGPSCHDRVLASAIARAMRARRRVLILGAGNRLFALLGRCLLGAAEWIMRKAMLDNLDRNLLHILPD